MKHTETAVPLETVPRRARWGRYIADTCLALLSIFGLTLVIFLLHLTMRLPDSLLLYLLAILALASTRGSYAALLAALLAFFSFDFFFVPPLYSLVIAKLADFLALIVFLVTAITTGQLTSALRKYAEQARRREREARILYRLVHETDRAGDVRQQLRVFMNALVEVFAAWQVHDGLLLLPDAEGVFTVQIRPTPAQEHLPLSLAEQELVAQVVTQAGALDTSAHLFGLRMPERPPARDKSAPGSDTLDCLVHLLSLKTPQEVLGVFCLLVTDNSQLLAIDKDLFQYPQTKRKQSKNLTLSLTPAQGSYTLRKTPHRSGGFASSSENGSPTPQAVFLRVFLEQAVALIERGRLQQESLRIKVLQETDALRAALLSSVSHDLRTPLSAIMTAATSLQHTDAQWDDEARQGQAHLIEHEAKRLNRLVENLLDMSRIEAGALYPNKVLYPLDELIRDVLGRLENMLQGRPLRLMLPADLPPVELDYMQIDQVVTNLLENAARYTPANSAIDIEMLRQREWIEVRIADRGPGVAVDMRERIFDKFYRVLGNVPRGSGLGLTVCKGLIEAHGGRIWMEARAGGGAVFCFTLPQSAMEKKEQ